MRLYGLFFLPFYFNIISPLNNKVCWSLSSRIERGDVRVPKLKVRILVLRTVLLLFWIDSDNLKYSKEVILIAYTCLWLLKIFIRLKMASNKKSSKIIRFLPVLWLHEIWPRGIYIQNNSQWENEVDQKTPEACWWLPNRRQGWWKRRGGEYQKQKSCHQSNLKAQCITQIWYETSARWEKSITVVDLTEYHCNAELVL